jgi:hypothetical protein
MTFLSDNYIKPKLIEPKTMKKVIISELKNQSPEINNKNLFLTNSCSQIIEIFKINYKFFIFLFIFIFALYWRYYEIKKLREENNNNLF